MGGLRLSSEWVLASPLNSLSFVTEFCLLCTVLSMASSWACGNISFKSKGIRERGPCRQSRNGQSLRRWVSEQMAGIAARSFDGA